MSIRVLCCNPSVSPIFAKIFTTDYTDYTDEEFPISAFRLLLFFPIRVIRVIRGKFLRLRLCRSVLFAPFHG